MEKSTGPTGLPRSSFADEFFDTAPFRNFDPQPGFPRRSTERGRFFEDDVGRFFDEFPVNDATRNFHEPAVFRSSLPRRPFPSSNRTHSGMERPIPVQRQQTTPQSSPNSYRKNTTSVPHYHQRSKSHHEGGDHWQQPFSNSFEHNNDDSHSRQFPPSSHPNDPNVHIINIRHEPTTQQQPKQPRFVEINNAQPNYANRTLNPDKRPRFSGQISQNDHNYANIRSSSIPNITVEDYGDGKSASRDEKEHIGLPPVIPLPAPAIPLPAPEHMIQIGNGKQEEMEGLFGNNEEELKKKSLEEEKQDKAMTHDFESVKVEEPKKTNAHLNFEPLADTGENLIRLLDETEQQVEMLRDTAMRMEQEKESLLDTIKNIKLTGESLKLAQGDRDELELNAERILLRCKAVDVYVNTPRNEQQSNALKHVNYIIQNVVDQMEENLASAKAKTNGYLNACDPNESGHIDAKFQLLVIECTADDQKKIRRRLVHILKQIEQAEQLMP